MLLDSPPPLRGPWAALTASLFKSGRGIPKFQITNFKPPRGSRGGEEGEERRSRRATDGRCAMAMVEQQHEVHSFAEMRVVVIAYACLPEPVFQYLTVDIVVPAIDRLDNASLILSLLIPRMERFGWSCMDTTIDRLTALSMVSDCLDYVVEAVLPWVGAHPRHRLSIWSLYDAGKEMHQLGGAIDIADVRIAIRTLGHRMQFSASGRSRAYLTVRRFRQRLLNHKEVAVNLRALQVDLD